ncbi:hypothetical protein [Acinetobacter qingfengensis]|uniref:DUF4199 domain-containing protein n=1 Tax=Acinetobacter qingfengensis TaxID=1262585 RepID=A0A1E7R947_9GAMM|nr:hypothetical protein [Acinetobacter qingfengensis]OEY95879.1 hypothetical protein BJI46_02890 [Acinetobacter qingfengensis]
MTDENSTSKSIFGWKGVLIATVCAAAFLAILYLAIGNEPDYMPSQKMKQQTTQKQEHSTHAASHDMNMSAEEMHMSSAEHAMMTASPASHAH